jgi:hypothetical protein
MRIVATVLLVSTLAALAGCASEPGQAPEPGADASPPPVPAALPGELPSDVPDREADPVAFWNWRIERMFLERDADKDGLVTRAEFTGNPAEFDSIDGDRNGGLDPDEVRNWVYVRYGVNPQSPAE